MKFGGIFVFFLIVVALIPFLYSYFGGKGRFYSAFVDMADTNAVSGNTEVSVPITLPTNYGMTETQPSNGICRQPAPYTGMPCPEGSFCDGSSALYKS